MLTLTRRTQFVPAEGSSEGRGRGTVLRRAARIPARGIDEDSPRGEG